MKYFTIPQIQKKYKKQNRTTILKWIHAELFPNAMLEESPIGTYWLIPESDLIGFTPPRRGQPKKKTKELMTK